MTGQEAREYLRLAVQTATGREALRKLGYGAIIPNADKGDDASSIRVALELADAIKEKLDV